MTTKPAPSTPPAPSDGLPAQYRPVDHEPRIREVWERSGAFHADPTRVLSGEREPFCVLIPPPNVTAALHLGHAFNNTLQDILVRTHRMMGFEALWMPGTDHAGIATQAVVERRLREEGKLKGPLRDAMTREEFVAKAQAWKDEYEAKILGQLKAMGCSCDWDRTRFTMDEICARAVREAFFQLFKAGLIYRGKRLVNWDPVLQTAVADDELEDREVEGKFYYLRYPLVTETGASTASSRGAAAPDATRGAAGTPAAQRADWRPVTWSELAARGYPGAAKFPEDQPAWVTVATTRPETYLGDTAVAINPKDPRAVSLRGLMIELPIVGRIIPIIEDDYVVMPTGGSGLQPEYGAKPHSEGGGSETDQEHRLQAGATKEDPKAKYATGFLKVTPGHDENDYALYQRHKAVMDGAAGGDGRALINIMAPDASISDKHGWSDAQETRAAHLFMGLSREKARDLVLREFQSREIGSETLLEAIKPYTHTVPYSDRSKVPIEPWLSDQWYVKVTDDRLRGEAQRALAVEQRSEASLGGTGLQPVPGWLAALDRIPPFRPVGFVGKDPYPPQQPSPRNLMEQVRDLPHLLIPGATYFVTWRCVAGTLDASERQIALDAIQHWHTTRWQVYAACVMPDHVHLLVRPLGEHDLGDIIGSVKRHSSREINKRRGVEGTLWQPERFDHIVRDDNWLASFLEYILQNPAKDGLAESADQYPWLRVQEAVGLAVAWHVREAGSGLRPEHRLQACATSDGEMRFFPERYAKTYESWHDNLRDWCVSRQLWWGHRIPVWHKERLSGWGTELDQDLQVTQRWEQEGRVALLRRARELSIDERQMRAVCVPDERDTEVIRHLETAGYKQDPDVLDTWFSSASWPISTLGWPEPEQSDQTRDMLAAFNPSTTLCTARDIITLWVSRMVMFNRFLLGSQGGPALRAGPSTTSTTPHSSAAKLPPLVPILHGSPSLNAPHFAPVRPVRFVGRDPYPKGSPSPSDLIRTHRRLPHVELPGATYFVTWRVVDGETLSDSERLIVRDAVAHWHERGCEVYGLSVMTTHVHAIVRLAEGVRLAQWCESIKRFSATVINKSRGESGSIWLPEQFDHVLRDEGALAELLHYVVNNAVTARVVLKATDDRFAWVSEEIARLVGGSDGSAHKADRGLVEGVGGPARRAGPPSGPPPFRDVYINSVIQDGHGQRMSKSLGNGVDPLDIVHSHGADAMRVVLAQVATSTQDVRMPVDLVCPHTGKTFEPKFITSPQGYQVAAPIQESPGDPSKKMVTPYGAASGAVRPTAEMPVARNTSSKFDLGRNFCNKLWNASRFALGILGKAAEGGTGLQPVSRAQPPGFSGDGSAVGTGYKPVLPTDLSLVDRWMLSRVQSTTVAVTHAIKTYQFSTYAQLMYDLMWRDFCDWYLEAIKPTVASSLAQQAVLAHTLESIVRLLHPLVPFITEAIWERLKDIETAPIEGVTLEPSRLGGLLCTAGWPVLDASLRDERAEAIFARMQALSGAIREVRAKHQVLPKRKIVLHVSPELATEIKAAGGIVEALCVLSRVETAAPAGQSVAFAFDAHEYRLSDLADAVDAGTERERLAKQIADLRKSVAALEGRLSNPGYADRAPPALVQQTRDEKTRKEADLAAAVAALDRLA